MQNQQNLDLSALHWFPRYCLYALFIPMIVCLIAMMSQIFALIAPVFAAFVAFHVLREDKLKNVSLLGIAAIFLMLSAFLTGILTPGIVLGVILRKTIFIGKFEIAAGSIHAWANCFAAASGLLLAAIASWRNVFWRISQLHQLQILPTAKARSAAIGLAELEGTAHPVNGRGSEPIFKVTQSWNTNKPDAQIQPFYLEDKTGKILVDPAGAKARPETKIDWFLGWADVLEGRLCEIVLHNRVEEDKKKRITIKTLMPGDRVYVIGSVQPAGLKENPSALVVKPLREKNSSSPLWRLLGKDFKDNFLRREFQDIFFLSDSPEDKAKTLLVQGLCRLLLLSSIWIASSLAVLWLESPAALSP